MIASATRISQYNETFQALAIRIEEIKASLSAAAVTEGDIASALRFSIDIDTAISTHNTEEVLRTLIAYGIKL